MNYYGLLNSSKSLICLIDFMASFADLTGYKFKDNEAEDSFSMFPTLFNENEEEIQRESTKHQSGNGRLSIRQGQWKLLLAPGSAGWSYPRPGEDLDGYGISPSSNYTT
jgi:hypothetical protein